MALFRPKNFYRQKNTDFCNLEKILNFTPIFVGLKKVQKDFNQSETTWYYHVIFGIIFEKYKFILKPKIWLFGLKNFIHSHFGLRKDWFFKIDHKWSNSIARFRSKMTENWNSKEWKEIWKPKLWSVDKRSYISNLKSRKSHFR